MSINSRESAIPAALMATIAACSQPESGTVIAEITPDSASSTESQICGKSLYNPGTCEEPVSMKMAPEVEKLLCETAQAIGNPENGQHARGKKTDFAERRRPR